MSYITLKFPYKYFRVCIKDNDPISANSNFILLCKYTKHIMKSILIFNIIAPVNFQ